MKDSIAPFCPSSPDAIGDSRCCVNGKPINIDASLQIPIPNDQTSNSIEAMVDVFKIRDLN